MRCITWIAVGLSQLALLRADESKLSFDLTTAAARKMNAGGDPAFEFGDATGPFKHVGGATVSGADNPHFRVDLGASSSALGGVGHAGINLRFELFVNEKGHGFGVIHKQARENPVPVAKEEAEEDDRPSEHVELCQAAEFAIARGNTALLQALLQAGLSVNLPLDPKTKWTPLHYCAVQNEPRVAKMLIENGAYLEERCRYNHRPIDYAFEKGMTELCQILTKPAETEEIIAGYPEDLLDELFGNWEGDGRDEVRFLSVNGEDPNEELLKYFRRQWPNVRSRSQAEEIDRKQEKDAKTSYRDMKTKDYGSVMELTLKKSGDDAYEWRQRFATGPSMAGGGSEGKAAKKYGYWLTLDTSGWDE